MASHRQERSYLHRKRCDHLHLQSLRRYLYDADRQASGYCLQTGKRFIKDDSGSKGKKKPADRRTLKIGNKFKKSNRIDKGGYFFCLIKSISLISDEASLTQRISKDIASNLRQPDVLKRSLERLAMYQELNTIKIDTNEKTVAMIANEIEQI